MKSSQLALITSVLASLLLQACGGGGGGSSDNEPPVASIASPVDGATFRAGETLMFVGSATDAQDGSVPDSRLAWWVDLHHGAQVDPLQAPTMGGSGAVNIPVRGQTSDNIFYRFHLRATDTGGLLTEVTRDVQPQKSQITLGTLPVNFPLTLDGQPVSVPYTFTGVVGIERDLSVSADIQFNGHNWRFDSWSDGGAATHVISTPAVDTAYTATFTDLGPIVNQFPVPVIASPASGATFRAGDTLTFSGSASDAEDGLLPSGNLAWWAELHHDAHTHPLQPVTPGADGSVTIPVRGETSDNIFYRFYLQATDSAAQTSEVTRDVLPQKVQVTLATQPSGMALALDGQAIVGTPFSFTGVVGIERDISAPDQQYIGHNWRFDSWSDAGAATHTISTPSADTVYTATFTDLGPIVNLPPDPVIASPASGATFAAGDTLTFTGSATDVEDGVLTGSSLTWWADLHHDVHTHPFQQPTSGGNGTVTIPVRGETSDNIFYRFHFSATDSAAQTVEVTRDVLPRKAQITLATQPAGLTLTLDGQPVTGPHTFTGVVGIERDLGAADQQANGRRYQFNSWSDGGAASHTVSTPSSNTILTATFIDVGPVVNQLPSPVITSPVDGATFRGGDTITFTGSATDFEDGTLPGSSLTWWADLHHDTHTHPFQLETTGGSGSVSIPVRGETSDNVFYRFHLRAADSNGGIAEVSRDVQPQKTEVTLASLPSGLQLALDGQLRTAPFVFTGVVGIERDLGAADQQANGRRYQFSSWSDGGPATHTIATPSVMTTYTATFADVGPVNNQSPSVFLTAPLIGAVGTVGAPMTLNATATDSDGFITGVEFFDGATSLGMGTSGPSSTYALDWTPATPGTRNLTARATDDSLASTTSAAVEVTINPVAGDTQAPIATLTFPTPNQTGLAGTLNLTATASDNVGVAAVEFQVDGVMVGSEDTAEPFEANVDAEAYARGQHVVRVRARDAAGNVSAWSSATVRFDVTRTLPVGFTITEQWIQGILAATTFTQTPDGRLFIAEQGGSLKVVKNGALLPTPFLQLAPGTFDANGERGLIGVTLHPNFAVNGWVYVYYTATENGTHNRVSRFTADIAGNPDVAVAGSEVKLIDLPLLSGSTNHNGGAMHFGPDGKLYVAVGENNFPLKAQDLTSPLGKILRFNEDGTIPGDNPFCTTPDLACAVWAYGLRNPFTFAFQPGTSRMHINDVGEVTWEEINLGAAGANYGWPGSEGPCDVTGNIVGPLFTYKHDAAVPQPGCVDPGGFFNGFSIVGAAFYPSSGPFPAHYYGNYFFADYVYRFVGRLDIQNGNAGYAFANIAGEPVDLLVGNDGFLYVLSRTGVAQIRIP